MADLATHWHAYHETRPRRGRRRSGKRKTRLRREPDAVLRTPHEVAQWLDRHARAHGEVVETWAGGWVRTGDEDDLTHQRLENFDCASRGDSIYTNVLNRTARHDFYVEAVTSAECTAHEPARSAPSSRRRGSRR